MAAAVLTISVLLTGAAAQTTFRVDVKLVRLLVTVKDSQGSLVGGLDRGDFSVYDSGVKQEIAVFERQTSLPLSIAVLIDASGSTAKEVRYEIQSVQKFFQALLREGNPADAAALYSFNYQVTQLSSYTRRQSRLNNALKGIKPEGGTSLYDAIYLASQDLEGRPGRHVIITVTDGGDTTSSQKYADALMAAHLADATLYPILVIPITNDAGRNTGGEHALELLASGTGGKVFTPSVGPKLDAVFTEILRDLRTQYLVGYYPRGLPEDAPRFHPVRVELARPGLRAQTRAGYYGESGAR
jgi:Ca-activated chloride channel family protein